MRLWIVLPALNEEHAIPRLVSKIDSELRSKGRDYRIVVVNDGSVDGTLRVCEQLSASYPLSVITHTINRGLGETERDAFEYVASLCADDDFVIRMDCDDTHEPQYFESLLKKINEGFDVVNTSRFQPGGGQLGVPAHRAWISYGANCFMRLMFWIPGVRDYSCGFRAYRAQVLKDAIRIFGNGFIQLKGLGFTSTLEMMVKLKMMGCRFAEVPFVLRYDQKAGKSKMVSSLTTFGYFSLAILYHWPFGGWRVFYRKLARSYRDSRAEAVTQFAHETREKNLFTRIGGG